MVQVFSVTFFKTSISCNMYLKKKKIPLSNIYIGSILGRIFVDQRTPSKAYICVCVEAYLSPDPCAAAGVCGFALALGLPPALHLMHFLPNFCRLNMLLMWAGGGT